MAWLGESRHEDEDGGVAIGASLWTADREYRLAYRLPGGPVARGPEPFLVAGLLLAMRAGEALRVPGELSPRLLAGIARVQEIFHVWDRRLRAVAVEARPAPVPAVFPGARGVACFFSGGVDSFYSVLKHTDEITALVFVKGWDPPLEDDGLCRRVAAGVRAAAGELGKPLIEVETNLYAVRKNVVRWRLYHGAALASIALLLAPHFRRVILPASHSYAQLFPWGSHPLVDPLWSTEATELAHDGCEATRVEKVARVAASATALCWLRVCFENRDGAYNCGRCEKCLRTMVALRAVGALEACRTFDHPLDLDAVSVMDVRSINARSFAEDNLRIVEEFGRDPALAEALRGCLERAREVGP